MDKKDWIIEDDENNLIALSETVIDLNDPKWKQNGKWISPAAKLLMLPDPARDQAAKMMMDDPYLLALILRYALPDMFGKMTLKQIVDRIQKISVTTPVHDEDLMFSQNLDGGAAYSKTKKEPTENIDSTGLVCFDVLVKVESGEHERILINIEMQNSVTWRDQVKRSLYYAARLISSQKSDEFHHNDYQNIKPVHAIWIFPNMKSATGTVKIFPKMENHSNLKPELVEWLQDLLYESLQIDYVLLGKDYQNSTDPAVFLLGDLFRNPDRKAVMSRLEKEGVPMEIKRTNNVENYVKYIPWPTYGDVDKLKNELASTKEELSGTKEKLASSEEELSGTKEKLASSEEELSGTKEKLASSEEELRKKDHKIDELEQIIQDLQKQLK